MASVQGASPRRPEGRLPRSILGKMKLARGGENALNVKMFLDVIRERVQSGFDGLVVAGV